MTIIILRSLHYIFHFHLPPYFIIFQLIAVPVPTQLRCGSVAHLSRGLVLRMQWTAHGIGTRWHIGVGPRLSHNKNPIIHQLKPFETSRISIYRFWINGNNSLVWFKAIWGWFPVVNRNSSDVAVRSLQFNNVKRINLTGDIPSI